MDIRQISDKDTLTVYEWFEKRKWPLPAVDGVFPPVGFVAESDGELLACAFLYTTGSSTAFLEWTCYSPIITGQLGMLALSKIIEHIKGEVMAKASPPIKVLRYYASNPKFAGKLADMGFKSGGEVTQLTWVQKD